ncbi:hypothetical protein CBM2637_A60075 [Cupriavidus taiwanensis]|uniref:hypothetical protein n=1 Tax=Cupriavidus taiwanensis TaxID=164546 RepID=UPI000E1B4E06|nr:hypothetical protein [Cupriavidus taiwanensis]SPA28537.1 hypothetical protein CBM2637_A60075 [Cupriavidus taiwanensis]
MNNEEQPSGSSRPHPRATFSLGYYHRVLTILIQCARADVPHKLIAKALDDAGLLAPSGSRWNVGILKAALYKLRSPDERPSRLYQALTRQVFLGMIAAEDARVLTAHPQ